jgi:phosphate transport system substrate-binding protein
MGEIQVMRRQIPCLAALLLGAAFMTAQADDTAGDHQPYQTETGISGNVTSVGSDTLANLMTLWAEQFKRFYPSVNIQIQAAGSSTAPPALTEGTANLGPMSRLMKDPTSSKPSKPSTATSRPPCRWRSTRSRCSCTRTIPSRACPIEQVDAVFSSNAQCGHSSDITKWGDLGLAGEWASRTIQLYGRNSVSGTYGYFKEHALCKGDFKNNVNEQPGSASVVQGVTKSLNGIGYSGIGYRTSGVRAVPIADKQGNMEEATEANALAGKYPLSRYLFIYVNKAPNKPMAPLERAFLRMVLSKEGQAIVTKDGYIQVPTKIADKQLQGVLGN